MRTNKRKPTSPGEILNQEYMKPLGLTQKALADHIEVDIKVINRLINGKTSVSSELALKLGAALGTSAEFWLKAQNELDLFELRNSKIELPSRIIS
ncbi:MAG: HigA family addiction module antitoxin [Bacteriovoracaceae bacterium]